MYFGPCPFPSRVHVLTPTRKITSAYGGLLAGFQEVELGARHEAIGAAQNKAALVSFAVTALSKRFFAAVRMKLRAGDQVEVHGHGGGRCQLALLESVSISESHALIEISAAWILGWNGCRHCCRHGAQRVHRPECTSGVSVSVSGLQAGFKTVFEGMLRTETGRIDELLLEDMELRFLRAELATHVDVV